MNRELLEKPFSTDQIKQRRGRGGIKLDYIEGHAVIKRLNECFDGDWCFEIVEHKITDNEVIVHGRLTAEGVMKSSFGGSVIDRIKDTGEIVSLSDDLKSAATDALKKAATLFGVGLHLYEKGSVEGHVDGAADKKHADSKNVTNLQIKAIVSLSKRNGYSNKDMTDFIAKRFGVKRLEDLVRPQASQVIDGLKERLSQRQEQQEVRHG